MTSYTFEDLYEIRIVCNNTSHPHHKGKVQHVEGMTLYIVHRNGRADGEPGWARTKRKEPAGAGTFILSESDPVQNPQDSTGVRFRYSFKCPRCHYRVVANHDRLTEILDKLHAAGVTQISLGGLEAVYRGLETHLSATKTKTRHSDTL